MATTRDNFIAQVRRSLKDTGSTVWADAEMLDYLKAALADYSIYFVQEKKATIDTVAGQTDYTLPTDVETLIRVEHPEGVVLVPRKWKPGDIRPEPELSAFALWRRGVRTRAAYYYEVTGTTLSLAVVPTSASDDIFIWYTALHTLPTSGSSNLTVPDRDLELLELYVKSKALERDAQADSRLSRWREDRKRDDNPVEPEYVRLMGRYREMVEKREPRRSRRVWRR